MLTSSTAVDSSIGVSANRFNGNNPVKIQSIFIFPSGKCSWNRFLDDTVIRCGQTRDRGILSHRLLEEPLLADLLHSLWQIV